MASARRAAPLMNANAWTKSGNENSRWSLPSRRVQPGNPSRRRAISPSASRSGLATALPRAPLEEGAVLPVALRLQLVHGDEAQRGGVDAVAEAAPAGAIGEQMA